MTQKTGMQEFLDLFFSVVAFGNTHYARDGLILARREKK
jgi:hypothetical protein